MKHLSRDFLTNVSASCPGTNMYALAIFLVGCGGFTVVGQTNFDLASGSLELAHGNSASINIVAGAYDVFLPTSSYLVSPQDVGRILVLKSQDNPRSNSGLFRVTAASSGSNVLTIDYRSAAPPPPEDFMLWRLFDSELSASARMRSGSNGGPRYSSYNQSLLSTASCSRIILRSPHPNSWQVRMCLESIPDVSGAVPSGFSIAPGYGGNGNGDYFAIPPGDGPGHDQRLFLHGAQWYDTTSSLYRGMTVGLTPLLNSSGSGPLWSRGQWRISMMVDDFSGSCGIINRNVSLPTAATSGSGWCVFGMTEDESEIPGQNNLSDPSINVARLFVAGSSNASSNLTWRSLFHTDNNMQVVGWSKLGYPVPGVLSCYSDISNPGNTHVRYAATASDTPWVNQTELLDVEVLVGIVDQTLSPGTTTSVFRISPRRLGRLPMFLQGRANFAQWKTTADASRSYYHTLDGVFMEWGGPQLLDGAGGSDFITIAGSIESQEGLMEHGAFLPGSDPIVPELPPNVSDIDASRFRKTYSYHRQVPVVVGHIKGGSNPSRS